jgi:rfaE bifunctional protein nucleotidyltransferase chain/domain
MTASAPVFTDIDGLLALAAEWRSQSLSVGFTCGAFDLLHAGHADYLAKAQSMCDRLVVGVNSDDSVRSYKSPLRPVVAQKHRMNLIAALRWVDAVVLMTDTRPASIISILKPELYIKGGDYGQGQLKSAPLVESYGGRVETIPVEYEISSSDIIRRIEELSQYASPEAIVPRTGPIVFLDRDGTLIENVHFLNDPKRVRLLDGVGEGLRLLQDQGFRLVVVTNQQGLALGYFDYDAFVATNSAMLSQLAPFGVKIEKFYYCPHSFADNCDCRKPGPLLLKKAMADLSARPEQCFMIGDSPADLEAAHSAGCRGTLITADPEGAVPDGARSFLDAARRVVELSSRPPA